VFGSRESVAVTGCGVGEILTRGQHVLDRMIVQLIREALARVFLSVERLRDQPASRSREIDDPLAPAAEQAGEQHGRGANPEHIQALSEGDVGALGPMRRGVENRDHEIDEAGCARDGSGAGGASSSVAPSGSARKAACNCEKAPPDS
jgi:hypothetical protein